MNQGTLSDYHGAEGEGNVLAYGNAFGANTDSGIFYDDDWPYVSSADFGSRLSKN